MEVRRVLVNIHITGGKENLFFFFFLGPYPWHIEVSRLRVESELQPLASTTITETGGSEPCLQPTPQLRATSDP